MLLTDSGRAGEHGDVLKSDPEVFEARLIADAARSRLIACLASPHEVIDLTVAQRMLDALRDARVLAGDAEDRVLVHRGLLTVSEAERRAAARHPASRPAPGSAPAPAPAFGTVGTVGASAAASPSAARVMAQVLIPVTAGLAGALLARRFQHR